MIDQATNPVKTYIRERTWNAFDEMAKEKALDFTGHQRDMARALADDLIRATMTSAVSDRHASFPLPAFYDAPKMSAFTEDEYKKWETGDKTNLTTIQIEAIGKMEETIRINNLPENKARILRERQGSQDELLPCPFCGGADLNRKGHFISSGGIGNPSTWHFFVECKTCKAHGPHTLKEGDRPTPEDHLAAITAWNKPRQ